MWFLINGKKKHFAALRIGQAGDKVAKALCIQIGNTDPALVISLVALGR